MNTVTNATPNSNENENEKDHSEGMSDTMPSIKKMMIDYYLEIMQELNKGNQDKEELDNLPLKEIISHIKKAVDMIIDIKANEKLASYNSDTDDHQYEDNIRRLEADIRWLYRRTNQLKLANQVLEDKLKMMIIKSNKQSDNDYYHNTPSNSNKCIVDKEKDYLILQAENSNLKATIAKFESIIQFSDQKEKEMNEEFDREKSQLILNIATLEQKLMISKHYEPKSIHSSSNINININDLSESNYVIKAKGRKLRQESKDRNRNGNGIHNCSNMSKRKKVEVIISNQSSQTPKKTNKSKRRIQSLKGKSSIQSKETSIDIEDEMPSSSSPETKRYQLKPKCNPKQLSGDSYSKKEYFINTYNKIMSMHSPLNIIGTNHSSHQHNTARKERKAQTMSISMPIPKENRSSSISEKISHHHKQPPNFQIQLKKTSNASTTTTTTTTGTNPPLLSKKKPYSINSFTSFKSPNKNSDNILFRFRPSTSREGRQQATINTVLKK